MAEISSSRTLHRLIYSSQIAVADQDLDDEIEAIIRVSLRNNGKVSVTGLLLVHEGYFLQALEGPAEMVLTTYGRITNDPRHGHAKVLQAGPAGTREFADWNMCARRITDADDAILRTLAQRDRFKPELLGGADALRLLTTIRGIQSRNRRQSVI